MKTRLPSSLVAALLVCVAAAMAPQTIEKVPEVDFVRVTELDASGRKQFQAYDVKCEACRGLRVWECQGCANRDLPNCTECKGTKKAPCRTCAGAGKLRDPLVEHVCTYCRGSAWYDCGQCAGSGFFYQTSPGGDQIVVPCGACKKAGRYPCGACGSKRVVETLRIKRKPATEAPLADLREARAEVLTWTAELEAFEPLDRAAKSTKALEKILARPGRTHPPLKDMLGLLEEVQKGLSRAGAGYQNFEERQNYQFLVFRNRSIHMLRHNLRVLDLCIERAEFNEDPARAK